MNRLQIIRNNLLAKGILDTQLAALLIDFENEYTELLDSVTTLRLEVKSLSQELITLTNKFNGDNVNSPVEDESNADIAINKDIDDAVAKAGSTNKDKGSLSANFSK